MLTRDDMLRYDRQIRLPEIGEEGQKKLSRKSILIVGLGGLGSISAYYLAAAGVGHLKIVDRDRVTLDNLNRQIIHCTDDIERPKVDSAREKLQRLNPACHIEPVLADFSEINGSDLAAGSDLIMDATDNLATRHVLNRVSQEKNIPYIFGGVNGWDGNAATFIPGETACLACLFPRDRVQDRGEPASAVGPTVGVIASAQSLEALLILLGLGPRLAGRMLDFRGLEMTFRTIEFTRNPDCDLCSNR